MPNFSISEFHKVVEGIARPAYFELSFGQEGTLSDSIVATVLARTVPIPGKTNNVIPVKYRGLEIKFPGDTTYDDWNVTFLADKDMKARKYIEDWYAKFFNIEDENSPIVIGGNRKDYQKIITVKQLGDGSGVKHTWTLHDAFPSQIAELEMGPEAEAPLELNVTFSYSFFKNIDTTG